jgi:hypothetical protein
MRKYNEWVEFEDDTTPPHQKVRVYVMLSGDYCAFHEVSLQVVYDITNNHKVGYGHYSKKKLENWEYTDYSDVKEYSALKIGDRYYVEI